MKNPAIFAGTESERIGGSLAVPIRKQESVYIPPDPTNMREWELEQRKARIEEVKSLKILNPEDVIRDNTSVGSNTVGPRSAVFEDKSKFSGTVGGLSQKRTTVGGTDYRGKPFVGQEIPGLSEKDTKSGGLADPTQQKGPNVRMKKSLQISPKAGGLGINSGTGLNIFN